MRRHSAKHIFSLIIALFATSPVIGVQQPIQETQRLSLRVVADKEVYLPGELISVRFIMKNESAEPLSLNPDLSVLDGNLKVFVASDDDSFREYIGPGWGTRDSLAGAPIELLPSESFETNATILWNQKLETSHLSELYKKPMDQQRLKTDYAFTAAGKYHLKAVIYNAKTGTTVESPPVAIVIESPQGAELLIWKQLKQDPDYAFFIQTGGLLEHPKGAKTAKVANELDRMLTKHPDSRYAQSIRRSLTKRQESIELTERDNQ